MPPDDPPSSGKGGAVSGRATPGGGHAGANARRESPGDAKSPPRSEEKEVVEEDDEDIFDMMVKQQPDDDEEDGSDADDDIREREEMLQRELEVATLRMEEIKKTLVQTKSFIQAGAAVDRDRDQRKDSKVGSPAPPPRASLDDYLDHIAAEYVEGKGGDSDEDYKDDYEDDDDDDAPGAKHVSRPPSTEHKHGPASSPRGSAHGADAKRSAPQPAQPGPRVSAPQVADARDARPVSVRRSEAGGGGTPSRSGGSLQERIQESKSLLVQALGEEVFRKAYSTARELQTALDTMPLDRREQRKRMTLLPILGDKMKYVEVLNQIIFMEDSLK
jgi:hypothetical protein